MLGKLGEGRGSRALKIQGRVMWLSGQVRTGDFGSGSGGPPPQLPRLRSATTILPPPGAPASGSQQSKGSFSPLLSLRPSSVPVPGLVPLTALFCFISLLVSFANSVSLHGSSLRLLSLGLSLLLWTPCLPYLCLLCLCLVLISSPAFLLCIFHLCLHPCLPLAPVSSFSHPYLMLVSICVPVSLLSFSSSQSLSLSDPVSVSVSSLHPRPHPRLRLFLVRVSVPPPEPPPWFSPEWDLSGGGAEGKIGVTRLSGRIELTSHKRLGAWLPSLLLGRRWGGWGKGSGPSSLARCVETKGLRRFGA